VSGGSTVPGQGTGREARPPGGEELFFGRRLLMCRPDHFTVLYEINPWMHTEVRPDPERAMEQFSCLVETIERAGAAIEWMEPVDGLPDLVFTANAGVVNGAQFVPARFRHPEREGESPHDAAWFAARGFRVHWLPEGVHHEGAGDALPFRPHGGAAVLVSGYRFRSDAASHAPLSRLLGVPVRSVELADPRLYHLDLAFCPLDQAHALIAPLGFDAYGLRVLEALVPEPVWIEDEEALLFCANSVVVGRTVVMPSCTPRLGRVLERLGFEVAVTPVEQFQLAGGGCRCLTLALDVDLARP
jgi:N-dimethylarginine dimethylaminohydrolase